MRSPAFALLLAAVLSPLSALADTFTYSYTGHPFNSFYGSVYTTADFVSGEFTLSAPLAPDTPLTGVTPLSFSFSDGLHTISSINPAAYEAIAIATDGNGNISHWLVDTRLFVGVLEYIGTVSNNGSPNPSDYAELAGPSGSGFSVFAYAQNQNNPGTWTETTTPTIAATPEPGSLMLLATGLAGTGTILRRRRTAFRRR